MHHSFIHLISQIVWLPIVIFMPALALNQGENAKYVNDDDKAMQFKFKKLIFNVFLTYFKI